VSRMSKLSDGHGSSPNRAKGAGSPKQMACLHRIDNAPVGNRSCALDAMVALSGRAAAVRNTGPCLPAEPGVQWDHYKLLISPSFLGMTPVDQWTARAIKPAKPTCPASSPTGGEPGNPGHARGAVQPNPLALTRWRRLNGLEPLGYLMDLLWWIVSACARATICTRCRGETGIRIR
jgi:hypothetical protein